MTEMNMTYMEGDGTVRSIGNATTWNDINVSALALNNPSAAPTYINVASSTILAPAFSGTSGTTALHGTLELLHDWKEGSLIYPHIHWAPTTTGAGNVKWFLEYMWVDFNGTYATSTAASAVAAAGGVAWKDMRLDVPAGGIDGTGHTIGGRFIFRIYRDAGDAADTYAADAVLLDFGVHYESDTAGSRTVTSK